MAYWHMQLHFDHTKWKKEIELLETKALIGLGQSDLETAYINFKNDMTIGDIVLIKRGAKPIALVKVVGSYEDIGTNDYDRLDWFRHRRKIEILTTDTKNLSSLPQPRKTLQKALNKYTLSYKYIDQWYKNYIKNKEDVGLKVNSIKIDNYKILNNFEIDFLDDNQKVLPLIVLVGKNGTGKTTLFDFLISLHPSKIYNISYILNANSYDNLQNHILFGTTKIQDNISEFKNNLIYLKAGIVNEDEIKGIESLFLDYIDYFIYKKSLSAQDGYDALKKDFNEIFEDFDLGFEFKDIDFKDKKPSFINKNSKSINDVIIKLNDLSTGEKTLLSKIFYLYLNEAKNKLILIDEPELSLHPSWQNKVMGIYEKFAKINNNQIIIATHSPHILASLDNKYIRVLKKDGDGDVKVVKDNLFANGRDMNSVLFDIMGEVSYRPKKFRDMIDDMHRFIDDSNYDKALEIFEKLKQSYGEMDAVIIEAKIELDMLKPTM